MMFYVRSTDKRTGITYVYESESYWDKESKRSRARRKLIGKIDENTGEIVPTGGRGRKKKDPEANSGSLEEEIQAKVEARYAELLRQGDSRIKQLEAENRQLKMEQKNLIAAMESLVQQYKA